MRLSYEAPAGCPDIAAFYLRVRARTQRVRFAAPDETGAPVSVHISTLPDGTASGTLEMPELDGAPFARRVDAATCDEVALALSLVLALAYDPDAITAFPAAPAPASPAPAPAPIYVPVLVPAAPAPPAPLPYALGVGLDVSARGGIAPGLTPVFGPFVEYGSARDHGLAPSVAAALLFAPTRDIAVGSGAAARTATLRFFGGRLAGCPVSVELVNGLTARPCLALDAGELLGGGGTGVSASKVGEIFWFSAEALARVRWKIVKPVFVEAMAGGGGTLTRGKFQLLGPNEPVFSVPAAFGEAGIGAGVHFP